MKVGILLSRCQPLHKGHIEVLKHMLLENDKVILVIGSANKRYSDRNPFSVDLRRDMFCICASYMDTSDEKLQYLELDDLSDDSDIPKQDNLTGVVDDSSNVNISWGSYLYNSIKKCTSDDEITFYYGDNPAIVEEWFKGLDINIKTFERIEGYSSSKVRQALDNSDMYYLTDALPYLNREQIIKLRYAMETRKEIYL